MNSANKYLIVILLVAVLFLLFIGRYVYIYNNHACIGSSCLRQLSVDGKTLHISKDQCMYHGEFFFLTDYPTYATPYIRNIFVLYVSIFWGKY